MRRRRQHLCREYRWRCLQWRCAAVYLCRAATTAAPAAVGARCHRRRQWRAVTRHCKCRTRPAGRTVLGGGRSRLAAAAAGPPVVRVGGGAAHHLHRVAARRLSGADADAWPHQSVQRRRRQPPHRPVPLHLAGPRDADGGQCGCSAAQQRQQQHGAWQTASDVATVSGVGGGCACGWRPRRPAAACDVACGGGCGACDGDACERACHAAGDDQPGRQQWWWRRRE